jgi:hypothetical protein
MREVRDIIVNNGNTISLCKKKKKKKKKKKGCKRHRDRKSFSTIFTCSYISTYACMTPL